MLKRMRARGLVHLDLSHNQIGDSGAIALGVTLKSHPSLRRVDVRSNSIGGSGANKLGQGLAQNSCLTSLDLSDNPLSDKGLASLAKALTNSRVSGLLELRLENTGVGPAGADALAKLLNTSTKLTTLEMGRMTLRGDAGTRFEAALKQHVRRQQLARGEANARARTAKDRDEQARRMNFFSEVEMEQLVALRCVWGPLDPKSVCSTENCHHSPLRFECVC